VVVAFTILALAGVGLFYIGSLSTTSNQRSKDHAAATALAAAKIEYLKGTPFAELTDDSTACDEENVHAGGSAGGIFTRSCRIFDQSVGGVPGREVTVTVSWRGGAGVSLTTLIVNPPSDPAGARAFVNGWNQVR